MTDDLDAERVLALDVGATNLKSALLDHHGAIIGTPHRRHTPRPCGPDELATLLLGRIERTAARYVAVGLPMELRNGRVINPGNLARTDVGADDDPTIAQAWRDFDMEGELRRRSGRDVRVANDARLALLGCVERRGREMVLALGTGCGFGVSHDGEPEEVLDLGRECFDDDRTYDEALGSAAQSHDTPRWERDVVRAVATLTAQFAVDTVHLAGGNGPRCRHLDFPHGLRVVVHSNDAARRGAVRLFFPEAPSAS